MGRPQSHHTLVRFLVIAAGLTVLGTSAGATPCLAQRASAGSVSGHVLNYDGSPQSMDRTNLEAGWFAGTPNLQAFDDWLFGAPPVPMGTWHPYLQATEGFGGDGDFTCSDLGAHPGQDSLMTYCDAAPVMVRTLALWGLDFSVPSQYLLQPSQTTLEVGDWPAGARGDVLVTGPGGGVQTTAEFTPGGAGIAGAPPTGFDDVVVSRMSAAGEQTGAVEWMSPGGALVPAPAGATASTTVRVDWSEALHARLRGATCQHAAAPGDTVDLVLDDWLLGSTARFVGYSATTGSRAYTQTFTSPGTDAPSVVHLTIPADATPGMPYWVQTLQADDPAGRLVLQSVVHVCTLRPSRTSIARGGAVSLTGRVEGRRRVTLFQRCTPAGVPGSVAAKGWTRVGDFPVVTVKGPDGPMGGRFTIKMDGLKRTTWFVALSNGVFTPLAKVTVR